ncbi:hypothetical protein [Mycobacteroides abscessus]|uniref:hypothetical protein n=1 Tax=Mycobacteroides abscessus TaxID=36809 RepID=UPI000929E6F7|nr:hypothetical protein [Mycobacteroides abscessus]SIJ94279.1 Uncharacterised protein [Mycobacteroides abscessus subsp. abscessus]
MPITDTPAWLDIETSHRAIEALTDLYIHLEDHPESDPLTMNAEEANAARTATRADEERWRNVRDTVCRWAVYAVLRAEMIGHDPTDEQVEAYSQAIGAMDELEIYRDHLRDETGRLVNAGLLTSDLIDQVAGYIRYRVVG